MSLRLLLFFPTSSHAAGEQTVNRNTKYMKNDKKNQTAKIKPTAMLDNKSVAMEMLKELHAKQGTPAIETNPQKTNIIKAAMDKDLARVQYTMNLLRV